MMRTKFCLFLVVFSLVVLSLVYADESSRNSDSTSDVKKSVASDTKKGGGRGKARQEQPKDEDEDEDSEIDDSSMSRSSSFVDRYLSHSQPETNYRTRTRWTPASTTSASDSPLPSSDDELLGEHDWSSAAYANVFPSALPSMSYDATPMTNMGSSCHSLIDPQYPVFSDLCGAVPQARYSLPNVFGHRERWQIAQVLNTLMSTTNEPVCMRSLRLLLCPILFPPCPTRFQPPPVLPCQSYCRAVKTRCMSPILDTLPCELLPYSSDLCPTNQAYGSFMPPASFSPVLPQSSPMTGGFPQARSFPSLQSLLSSPAFQAALSAQGFQSGLQPQTFQAALAAQNMQQQMQTPPPSAPTSNSMPSAPTSSPFNLFNGASYTPDSPTSMMPNLPSRRYMNDYQQTSRYGSPLTRSSADTRSTIDLRSSTGTRSGNDGRSSGVSSIVKA